MTIFCRARGSPDDLSRWHKALKEYPVRDTFVVRRGDIADPRIGVPTLSPRHVQAIDQAGFALRRMPKESPEMSEYSTFSCFPSSVRVGAYGAGDLGSDGAHNPSALLFSLLNLKRTRRT